MSDLQPTFHDEVMLMAWGESDTQGPWVKLRLPNHEALEPFRGMTKAKGDKAGQRLACSMVEIADDEEPVQTKPGVGPLCKLAVMWCGEESFLLWLNEAHRNVCKEVAVDFALKPTFEACGECVRRICGVLSRKDLDTDQDASRLFHEQIRIPYNHWLQHRE